MVWYGMEYGMGEVCTVLHTKKIREHTYHTINFNSVPEEV